MWESNHRTILWISWLLTLSEISFAQIINDSDGPEPTIDFIANDESVVILPVRNEKSYVNLQYEVPSGDKDEYAAFENDAMRANSTQAQSRIGLGFLFGDKNPLFGFPGRPTRRIPTVENKRRNGISSQEYDGNPYLLPTTNNNNNVNNFNRFTTRKTPTKKPPNNKQSQWQPNLQEFDVSPQQSSWQQPSSNWQSTSNAFINQNNNQFQNNNNGQQSFPQNQQNWGSPFGNSNWETSSTKPQNSWQQPVNNWQSPSNNNNWQQTSDSWQSPASNSNNNRQQTSNSWQSPSANKNTNNWQQPSTSNAANEASNNAWGNEDKPTWGSQSQSWTTKKPTSSWGSNWQQTTSTTTKRPNSGWGGDDQPVWTEKTTTSGRYRPSPTRKPQRKSISELKCEEFSKPYTQTINALPLSLDPELLTIRVGKCDRNAQALIVGGQKSELGEFPHMVAVGFKTGRGLSWNCGGSLISENYVLTAAHCTDSSLGKPVAVRLGELNLVRNDDGASPENYKVVQVVAHPEYRSAAKYNDIALLRLDRQVEFSNTVRPACLYSTDKISESRAIATGWGALGFGDRSSDILLKVGLSFIDNRKCATLYRSEQSSSLQRGIIDSQLCAGELQGGYDTCLGDSGGPLQVTSDSNKCIYKIVGITSFGKFCGERNSPGVYTRVSAFVPWIESVVWP